MKLLKLIYLIMCAKTPIYVVRMFVLFIICLQYLELGLTYCRYKKVLRNKKKYCNYKVSVCFVPFVEFY